MGETEEGREKVRKRGVRKGTEGGEQGGRVRHSEFEGSVDGGWKPEVFQPRGDESGRGPQNTGI